MEALERLLVFLESEFLCLAQLDDDYVVSSYDSNFSDYDEISNLISFSVRTEPAYYEKLNTLYQCLIDVYFNQSTDGIWDIIKERVFDSKKLCLLLWFSFEDTFKSNNNREELEEGILSARVYMLICCLNSAQAYEIFNPFLYQKAISVLRILYRALSFNCTDFNATKAAGNKKGKSKKKKDMESSESEGWTISDEEKIVFYDLLKDSLESLFLLLDEISLSSSEECVNATVSLVRDVARFDLSSTTHVGACSFEEFQALKKFGDRSFALSHRLCQARHAGLRLVLPKLCLPRLLLMNFENDFLPSNSKIPNYMLVARDKMIEFLEIYTDKHKEYASLMSLVQNVAYRCPDRADYRVNVSTTIILMLRLFPFEYCKNFLNFLYAFGSINKPASRLFAVDLAVALLSEEIFDKIFDLNENSANDLNRTEVKYKIPETTLISDENNLTNNDDNPQRKRAKKVKKRPQPLETMSPLDCVFNLLIRGAQDKSAAIRSRSLQIIQPKLEDFHICDRLNDVAKKIERERNDFVKKNDSKQLNAETAHVQGASLHDDGVQIVNLTDHPLLNLFLQNCEDSRVTCRKWALVALTILYLHLPSENQRKICIEIFESRCRDQSTIIRKQAAESLTFLMQQRFSEDIEKAWLNSVLSQIVDREISVQQKCSEFFHAIVIVPIMDRSEGMVWGLLHTIERERLLLRCLLYQYNEKHLPAELVGRLIIKTESEHTSTVAWMMLAEISVFLQVNSEIVIDSWFKLNTDSDLNTTSYIAKILANCVDDLTNDQRERLKTDISRKLLDYKVHVLHISSVYYAFARICNAIGEDAPGTKFLEQFNSQWLVTSTQHVDESIYQPIQLPGSRTELHPPVLQNIRFSNIGNINEEKLIKIIFSIGECIQYTPRLINNDIFEQLKLMMASDVIATVTEHYAVQSGRPTPVPVPGPSLQNTEYGFARPIDSAPNSQRPTEIEFNSQQPNDFGSQRQTEFATLTLRPTDFRGTTFKQNRTICTEVLTKRVRAQAVLTLGKLCLQDEKLAKKCIPVFARQLKVNKDHIIRNNIVVVICDLCIRYTLLVDRYSAILASCLKDNSVMIRHQTITLLTNLINEQFLKWEGQLMYRFVSTLLDSENDIKEYSEFCLKDILLLQFPKMFVNHFLECLFYFNNVPLQSISIAAEALGDEIFNDIQRSSTLSGKHNTDSRMHLYKFMITTFSDEEKFNISVKICKEVFQQLVDGILRLSDPDVEILFLDSIEIMCCQEMKLSLKEGDRDPDDEDEDEPPEHVREGARKVIANVFRQGIVEAIMPHVIALKHFLSEKRCPLIREAIRLIVEICKNHKEKIDEFLAGDAQLKAEIEFDIKRLQEKEKRKKAAEAQEAILKARTFVQPTLIEPVRPINRVSSSSTAPLSIGETANKADATAIHTDAIEIQEDSNRNIKQEIPELVPMEITAVEISAEIMEKTACEIEPCTGVQNKSPIARPLILVKNAQNERSSIEMDIPSLEKSPLIPPRAISTPEYSRLDNLTFAALDLSAIPMASPIIRTQRKREVLREIKEEPE